MAGDLFTAAARRDPSRARIVLRDRLEERRGEMEETLLARVYGVADPTGVNDPAYLEGLRRAAAAAIDFGLETIASSQDRLPLPPAALLTQARLAARNGIGLDTILRRYAAGHAMLVDFLVEGVEREGILSPAELRKLLAISSAALDRLVAAVSEEHARELESRANFSREGRLAERVERLLAGEAVDMSDLRYELGGWHLGVVAKGGSARERLRDIAATLGCCTLVVDRDDALAWAWLGSRQPLNPDRIVSLARSDPDTPLAVGEPGADVSGWRFTHRQALAAFSVTLRGEESTARYADVAFVAALVDNELLRTSLHRTYLDPLAAERDGGEALRETLQAYFKTAGNISSAAALMGVTRRTIKSRLQRVEQLVGRPWEKMSTELEIALRMREHLRQEARAQVASSGMP